MKDRFEFLEKLRQSLVGRIDSGTLQDTMNYYQEYFEIQMRSGKSEQEILEQLGDPRLLAKSILQAEQRSSMMQQEEYEEALEEEKKIHLHFGLKQITMPRWLALILGAICLVLFVVVFFYAFWLSLPIILVVTAACLMARILKDLFR